MEKLLFFGAHYGVLAIALLVTWRRQPLSLVGAWSTTILIVTLMLFFFAWGQWPLVGSYYLRTIPILVVAAAVFGAMRSLRKGLPLLGPGVISNGGSAAALLLAAFVAYGLALCVTGKNYPSPAIDLEFPLRDGRYYVASGGSRQIINNHMRGRSSAQDFALDINKLGAAGGASANVFSVVNEKHHIYGERVYAPCGGTVLDATNSIEDNTGSAANAGAKNGPGNYVKIDCNSTVIALLHLKFGSVVVAAGDHVTAGQLIGKVGNSGFSQEPHLHLQAARRNSAGKLRGVPMRFNGNTYARNDVLDIE